MGQGAQVNAALIGVLVLAIAYVTVDGAVKIRAMHQRAQRPVSPRRMSELNIVHDPLLDSVTVVEKP